MKTIPNVALLLTFALSLARCTDPTVIGGDLLEDSELRVTYNDTLPLDFSVVAGDPAIASARFSRVLPLGCYVDSTYGEIRTTIGAELVEFDSVRQVLGNAIDSVLLVLPFDASRQVGDTTAEISIRVSAAAQNTLDAATIDGLTTDDAFEGTDRTYAEARFVPARDSALVNNFNNGTLTVDRTTAQVRIPLNDAFEDDLRAALGVIVELDTLATDSAFLSMLPGIVIESTSCGKTAAALQINDGLSAPSQSGLRVIQPSYFGVLVYFRDDQDRTQTRRLTPFRRIRPTIARVRLASTRNTEGTYVNEVLGGGGDANTLAVVEGFNGATTRIDLPDVSSLTPKTAVSYAALQLPIARVQGAGPLSFVEAVRSVGDTALRRVSPLSAALPIEQRLSYDGGFIRMIPNPQGGATDSVEGYQLNITDFVQRVAKGEMEPTLYIQPYVLPIGEARGMPASSLLLGPEAEGARARLVLATTQLP